MERWETIGEFPYNSTILHVLYDRFSQACVALEPRLACATSKCDPSLMPEITPSKADVAKDALQMPEIGSQFEDQSSKTFLF